MSGNEMTKTLQLEVDNDLMQVTYSTTFNKDNNKEIIAVCLSSMWNEFTFIRSIHRCMYSYEVGIVSLGGKFLHLIIKLI